VLGATGVAKVFNGDQALNLVTVGPVEPFSRVMTEVGPVGEYSMVIETRDSVQLCFLHLKQARSASEGTVVIPLQVQSEEFTLTIQHPRKGNSRLVFGKHSLNRTGLQFAQSHLPSRVTPVLDRVQDIRVTSDGPHWETLPA